MVPSQSFERLVGKYRFEYTYADSISNLCSWVAYNAFNAGFLWFNAHKKTILENRDTFYSYNHIDFYSNVTVHCLVKASK